MAQMKVSDLPKEEQDKLIAEANELEIRGIFTSWGVETLKNKIAEAKAAKAGNGEQGEQGEQGDNAQGQEQEQTGDNEQNAGENEQNDGKDEQNEGEDEQNPPEDEQNAENVNNDESQNGNDAIPDEGCEKEDEDLPCKPKNEVKICHICRSKVIDGKCTGCGFSV